MLQSIFKSLHIALYSSIIIKAILEYKFSITIKCSVECRSNDSTEVSERVKYALNSGITKKTSLGTKQIFSTSISKTFK